jgi:MFS family permease
VLAATVGYGTGASFMMMTAGLFVLPMRDDFGGSTSAVTIAPIFTFLMAIGQPVSGLLADRWGSRAVALVGLTLLPLSVLVLATAPAHPSILYACAALIGVTGALTGSAAFARLAATWFDRRFGSAFGIITNGASLVTFLAAPLLAFAIQHHGWRGGYIALASVILLIGLPINFWLFREGPNSTRAEQSGGIARIVGALKSAIANWRFWVLAFTALLASMALGGFLSNLPPILGSKGFDLTMAASMAMVYAMSVSIGRIVGGLLLDHFRANWVAAGLLVAAGIGGLMLGTVGLSTPLLFLTVIVGLVGLGQGAEVDFIAFFSLKLFGTQSYSAIVGFLTFVAGSGMALGGIGFALIYDHWNSYLPAIRIGGGCFIAAGVIMLLAFRGNWARPAGDLPAGIGE